MKAISLWQPWASLIACGQKKSETRHWDAPLSCIGETLAIHAAKSDKGRGVLPARLLPLPFESLPRGVVVCTAKLFWCSRVVAHGENSFQMQNGLTWVADPFGDYGIGRSVWALGDIRPLNNHVPVRGRQSIWSLDAETTARVIAEGGAA